MKQAIVTYHTESTGRVYRIGWRKAHEGTSWFFESYVRNTDGTEQTFVLDHHLSLGHVLDAVKYMKSEGYIFKYELI